MSDVKNWILLCYTDDSVGQSNIVQKSETWKVHFDMPLF